MQKGKESGTWVDDPCKSQQTVCKEFCLTSFEVMRNVLGSYCVTYRCMRKGLLGSEPSSFAGSPLNGKLLVVDWNAIQL